MSADQYEARRERRQHADVLRKRFDYYVAEYLLACDEDSILPTADGLLEFVTVLRNRDGER